MMTWPANFATFTPDIVCSLRPRTHSENRQKKRMATDSTKPPFIPRFHIHITSGPDVGTWFPDLSLLNSPSPSSFVETAMIEEQMHLKHMGARIITQDVDLSSFEERLRQVLNHT